MYPRLLAISAITTLPIIWCATQLTTIAQIVPDRTLGSESSVVTPNQNIRGINSEAPSGAATLRIDGGAIRGGNLFHSFQEFNIEEGRGAYFSNPDNIINILTRVTGGNISEILGTLGVLGNANLFLINPNGIVFGPNARLDVGGSFFATTADGILFENGVEFAASNPEAQPLLTINMPLGLNIRENPGRIVNQTIAVNISDATPSGLYVPQGETIAFIGGDVQFEGGVISSPGSQIQLGGLAEPGTVGLNLDQSLSFPISTKRANILLTDGAFAGVAGNPGGNIGINAQNLEISGGSQIVNGIDTIFNSFTPRTENLGADLPQAGEIRINSTESVRLTDENSIIENQVSQDLSGNAGNINIQTHSLFISDGAQISTATFGKGDGGNLTVSARNINLIGTSTQGEFSSGLFASLEPGATGNAGNINIQTSTLSLQDGAQISSGTFGKGDGGNLTVSARNINLIGTSTQIDVRSENSENAGNLEINTPFVLLDNQGSLNAETTAGQGNIILNIEDLRLRNNSQITTNATGMATGGNIEINTNTLIGIGNSDISANAQAAFGGQVVVNADPVFGTDFRIQQTDASDITATSELGSEFNGTVELNNETDPAQGLVDLPQTIVDPNDLIAQDPCKLGTESAFFITGRGGIAPDPTQELTSIEGFLEWESFLNEPVTPQADHSVQPRQQRSRKRDNNRDDHPIDSRTIIPARGWIRTEDGEIILVGYDPTKTGIQRQPKNPYSCQI